GSTDSNDPLKPPTNSVVDTGTDSRNSSEFNGSSGKIEGRPPTSDKNEPLPIYIAKQLAREMITLPSGHMEIATAFAGIAQVPPIIYYYFIINFHFGGC